MQLPAAVPGSLFGLAFSLSAAKIHFHVSAFLIVVAMIVGFMPFSYRIITTVFSQLKTTLDDGASSLGAGKMQIFTTILLPLCRGGLFSSFIYDFVRAVGTISAVIFLVSFTTPLASIRILNLAEEGEWGKSAALATILTSVTFGILALGRFAMAIKFKKKNKDFGYL